MCSRLSQSNSVTWTIKSERINIFLMYLHQNKSDQLWILFHLQPFITNSSAFLPLLASVHWRCPILCPPGSQQTSRIWPRAHTRPSSPTTVRSKLTSTRSRSSWRMSSVHPSECFLIPVSTACHTYIPNTQCSSVLYYLFSTFHQQGYSRYFTQNITGNVIICKSNIRHYKQVL